MGTFTSGGLHVRVGCGSASSSGSGESSRGKGGPPPLLLSIASEGKHAKFKASVGEVTFAGSSAGGREIVYVTERAVFRLREEEDSAEEQGRTAAAAWKKKKERKTVVELCEVAPGIDIERDLLSKMAFRPAIPLEGVKLMDSRVLVGV